MGVRPFNAHFKLLNIINQSNMTTINSFGDFQASTIISEERLKYLKNTGIEIINCELYNNPSISSVVIDYKAFLITFKVTSTTFVYFMNAGIDYSMDKYCKS